MFSAIWVQSKSSSRRQLFHPDDINTVGFSGAPGPPSAPFPGLVKTPSKPHLAPIVVTSGSIVGPMSATRPSHSRSSSIVGLPSNGGSVGRSEARRAYSQSEFDKYTEDDDEDYEDVFGKPNGPGA
jgi:hypothetical protein